MPRGLREVVSDESERVSVSPAPPMDPAAGRQRRWVREEARPTLAADAVLEMAFRPAVGFVNSRSNEHSARAEFPGAEIARFGLTTARVAEVLDVVKNAGTCFVTGAADLSGRLFGLQRREDALHRPVVPDSPCPALRPDDAVVGHPATDLPAAAMPTQIRSMHQRVRLCRNARPRSSKRHVQRPVPAGLHEPADSGPPEKIQLDCDMEQALCSPDTGEVGQPPPARPICLEIAVEDVVALNQ